MTKDEFLSLMQSRGAKTYPGVGQREIILANSGLQTMRRAMLPRALLDLYATAGAINLGTGYIFGPSEIDRSTINPIPSITKINGEITNIDAIHGKTVVGRNDLFWFAFDAFGIFYMLDNLTLKVLRKYDDPYRAMTDCLIAGKF